MTERDGLFEALDASLASLEAGANLENVLTRYPALAADLRPLLLAALLAGAGEGLARVPARAQAASRSQFLARDADGRPAIVPAGSVGWWSRLRSRLGARPVVGGAWLARAVAVALVVVAGLGAGGYGAVAASAQSLPGDPLYGVKRTVEGTQLLLASDEQARARLQAEFDDRRVHEVQALAMQGRQAPVEFTGTLISMDGALSQHWLVSGIAVLVGPQVPVDGVAVVGAQVQIQGTVASGGEVIARRVTVLSHHGSPPDATPTASPSPTSTATVPAPVTSTAGSALGQATAMPSATATGSASPAATATATPSLAATTEATAAAPDAASPTPTATKPPPDNAPPPTVTQTASPTDDHGGGPAPSHTPEATEGGDQPQAPEATEGGDDHGGGSSSETPEPTESGDHGGGSGPSSANTPQPDSGGAGTSPASTPKPQD